MSRLPAGDLAPRFLKNVRSCRSPSVVPARRTVNDRAGRRRPGERKTAAEQVGVAGPAGGQVVAVGHGEGRPVIGGGAARAKNDRSAQELAARVVQGCFDLLLDVGGIGPVVAAEPPGGGQVFHVLGQAGRPAVGQHAAAGGRIAGSRQHQDAVADRGDGRPARRKSAGPRRRRPAARRPPRSGQPGIGSRDRAGRSVAKTTSCPPSRSTRHGTATSVTSKSRSGSGISTRTRLSSRLRRRASQPCPTNALSHAPPCQGGLWDWCSTLWCGGSEK